MRESFVPFSFVTDTDSEDSFPEIMRKAFTQELITWLVDAEYADASSWTLLWIHSAPSADLLACLEPGPRWPPLLRNQQVATKIQLRIDTNSLRRGLVELVAGASSANEDERCSRDSAASRMALSGQVADLHSAMAAEMAKMLGINKEDVVVTSLVDDGQGGWLVEYSLIASKDSLASPNSGSIMSGQGISDFISSRSATTDGLDFLNSADKSFGVQELERLNVCQDTKGDPDEMRAMLEARYVSQEVRDAAERHRRALEMIWLIAGQTAENPSEENLAELAAALAELIAAGGSESELAEATSALNKLRALHLIQRLKRAMLSTDSAFLKNEIEEVEAKAELCGLLNLGRRADGHGCKLLGSSTRQALLSRSQTMGKNPHAIDMSVDSIAVFPSKLDEAKSELARRACDEQLRTLIADAADFSLQVAFEGPTGYVDTLKLQVSRLTDGLEDGKAAGSDPDLLSQAHTCLQRFQIILDVCEQLDLEMRLAKERMLKLMSNMTATEKTLKTSTKNMSKKLVQGYEAQRHHSEDLHTSQSMAPRKEVSAEDEQPSAPVEQPDENADEDVSLGERRVVPSRLTSALKAFLAMQLPSAREAQLEYNGLAETWTALVDFQHLLASFSPSDGVFELVQHIKALESGVAVLQVMLDQSQPPDKALASEAAGLQDQFQPLDKALASGAAGLQDQSQPLDKALASGAVGLQDQSQPLDMALASGAAGLQDQSQPLDKALASGAAGLQDQSQPLDKALASGAAGLQDQSQPLDKDIAQMLPSVIGSANDMLQAFHRVVEEVAPKLLVQSIEDGDAEITEAFLHVSQNAQKQMHELKNKQGGNALHIAAAQGNALMIQALARHGCDSKMSDDRGYTCLDVAVENLMAAQELPQGEEVGIRTDKFKECIHVLTHELHARCTRYVYFRNQDLWMVRPPRLVKWLGLQDMLLTLGGETVLEAFHQIDTNHSGSIVKYEWSAFFESGSECALMIEALGMSVVDAFSWLDKIDSDGKDMSIGESAFELLDALDYDITTEHWQQILLKPAARLQQLKSPQPVAHAHHEVTAH
ncbi:unnamed protein product [Polarella glacialis]|uniref:Uncharacterized protein n=1 Tax=Polarella glacialis TaxID=89957 RepID=A0A813F8A8_POLGL|nr:unnamed protein product [Polarella glacialis]